MCKVVRKQLWTLPLGKIRIMVEAVRRQYYDSVLLWSDGCNIAFAVQLVSDENKLSGA